MRLWYTAPITIDDLFVSFTKEGSLVIVSLLVIVVNTCICIVVLRNSILEIVNYVGILMRIFCQLYYERRNRKIIEQWSRIREEK